MRTLIYVPIIHTSADLGSLAGEVSKRAIADLGEEFWRDHQKTVSSFWDAIIQYFDYREVSGFKIYQDGMAAEKEIGEKIIEESIKSGSRNYQLVKNLILRGAILIKTEDFNLVKAERDRLIRIIQAKTLAEKLLNFIIYKLTKNTLLNQRDEFIAGRINQTLEDGQTGILFLGAYHNIKRRLYRDIKVKEIKEVEKVKEYHSLLPYYSKHKKRFEELCGYLVSGIE